MKSGGKKARVVNRGGRDLWLEIVRATVEGFLGLEIVGAIYFGVERFLGRVIYGVRDFLCERFFGRGS